MMTDIPFGIAEINGEPVTVAELNFAEIAAFVNLVPNHHLLFDLIRSIDYSGKIPVMGEYEDDESELLEKTHQFGFIPSSQDIDVAQRMFSKWVSRAAETGMKSLSERGLLIQSGDAAFKTHRSIENMIRVLRSPVEHISYRTSQVPDLPDDHHVPLMRSSIYALQSISGDWMVAEHFQSQEFIRFICIPGAAQLAHHIYQIIEEGVERSISSKLVSATGIEYRPFSVVITRTNEHGAFIVGSAQRDSDGKWYTPYQGTQNKFMGDYADKMGNPFTTKQEVADIATAPYNQFDIRNGADGWFLVGNDQEFVSEVSKFTQMTLHSEADHIPDTIPDFFFDDKDDS